jgi:hypothetical protein
MRRGFVNEALFVITKEMGRAFVMRGTWWMMRGMRGLPSTKSASPSIRGQKERG